uniref:DinB family protein n=1 Tax=Flavobacterium sp. TaxID=239 RepID=UPI004049B01A
MLIATIKANFIQIIELLHQLKEEEYIFCHSELSNASIGEHTRHIIELYQQLLKSYASGIVNYDKRERNIIIQTNKKEAISAIHNIIENIDLDNIEMTLEQGVKEVNFQVATNYYRELLYNLEHSIHHQALIKVVVLKNKNLQLCSEFGIAKSTIEYRKQCAQ